MKRSRFSAQSGVGGSSPPQAVVDAFNLIYAAEDTTTQGTVDVTSKVPSGGALAASAAFDEPLTKAQSHRDRAALLQADAILAVARRTRRRGRLGNSRGPQAICLWTLER